MAVSGKRAKDKLSASILLGSEEDQTLICQPCSIEERTHRAVGFCIDCDEHLCNSCFTGHRKSKPCRNHKLLDKHAMPKSHKPTLVPQADDRTNTLSSKCEKHTDELIKYYCQDHKLVLCSVCAMLEHRNCHIDYIPDIAGDIVDGKQYTDVIERIEGMLEQCQVIRTDTNKSVDSSDRSLLDALKDLRKFRQDMNAKMDKLEQNIENEAKSLMQENANRLQCNINVCDGVEKSVKSLHGTIKQLNTANQAAKLYVELQLVKDVMDNHKENIDKLTQNQKIREYNFISNQNLRNVYTEEKSLGKLLERKHSSRSEPTVSQKEVEKQKTEEKGQEIKATSIPKEYSLSHVYNISPHTCKDMSDCKIVGMAVTPSHLLLADHFNMSIKMVDLKNKVVASEIALPAAPWDVTLITPDELAVTLPKEKSIQFLSVSDKLSVTHNIKLKSRSYGITCSQNRFAVTYQASGPRLEILTVRNGSVITTVTVDTYSKGKAIFLYPEYAASTDSAIYISDWGQGAVIQLNWNGQVLGKVSVLGMPKGIAVTAEGTVYVCQFGSGNVTAISSDFERSKVVLKLTGCLGGGATFCNRNHILYVRDGYGGNTIIKGFRCE